MTVERPTFLYDGDCAFCGGCARFVVRRIPTRAVVVAWQRADLTALGVPVADAAAAVRWTTGHGRALAGPDAIAALLRDAGGAWRFLGTLLASRPVRPLAWPVYRWVSRHRDRLPGGTPSCAVPLSGRPGMRQTAGEDR